MPIAQISWNPWRRSRHWSKRATAKTSASSEVRAGSGAVGTGSGLLVGGDEAREEPIEQPRCLLEHGADAVRAEARAASDDAQLGEEWASGRDEQADRLGQAQATAGEAAGEVVDEN